MENNEKLSLADHDLSVPVNFTIVSEIKKSLGISLGMKCTNNNGQEFEEWVNHMMWANNNGKAKNANFISKLDKGINIEWDGDNWIGYDPEKKVFKFITGKCTIDKKGKYYNLGRIIESSVQELEQEEQLEQPKEKESEIDYSDIPF